MLDPSDPLRVSETLEEELGNEARKKNLSLNAYLLAILGDRHRIGVCGGFTTDVNTADVNTAAVRLVRESIGDSVLGIYRLYDSIVQPAWRAVIILAPDAPPTRKITPVLNRLRSEFPEGWARVYRLTETSEIRERDLSSWFEFSVHASPVYLADERVPRLLQAIRVRLAEGEWRRSAVSGAWARGILNEKGSDERFHSPDPDSFLRHLLTQ